MPPLSLDALTLTKTTPDMIVRSAAAAGFDLVSLAVQAPYVFPEPLLTPEKADDCARALADTGVEVRSLEFFILADEEAMEAYRPALELGARIGGKAAVILDLGMAEPARGPELLARFAAIAGDYGLGVNFEPVAGGQISTLAETRNLIRASGADVGIVFDPLHLTRAGGTVEDLKAIEPELIRYIQINDGPVTIAADQLLYESTCERLYPGHGAFPLVELLQACPHDVPVAIEAPSLRRCEEGIPPEDQAREAMAAVKEVMARAGIA